MRKIFCNEFNYHVKKEINKVGERVNMARHIITPIATVAQGFSCLFPLLLCFVIIIENNSNNNYLHQKFYFIQKIILIWHFTCIKTSFHQQKKKKKLEYQIIQTNLISNLTQNSICNL